MVTRALLARSMVSCRFSDADAPALGASDFRSVSVITVAFKFFDEVREVPRSGEHSCLHLVTV